MMLVRRDGAGDRGYYTYLYHTDDIKASTTISDCSLTICDL